MRKSDYLIDAIYNLIVITACCAIFSVAATLVCKIIASFIEAEFFTYAVIRSVVMTVGTLGAVCAVKYKEGFKASDFSIKVSVIGNSLGALAHVIVGLVLSFSPIFSGSPLYLSGIVRYGAQLDREMIFEGGIWITLIFAFVFDAACVALGNFFKSYGAQSRKIEKYNLTGKL